MAASQIDLVLANHVALPLVQRLEVLTNMRDGGHSPVLVDVQLVGPVAIVWRTPQPRLPALMMLGSEEMQESVEWAALVEQLLALTG